jgi:hypothetical protein
MTLRVSFNIVPFGVEEEIYPLGYLNIHNTKRIEGGKYSYSGKLDLVDEKGVTKNFLEFSNIEHHRDDGFLALVTKVLKELSSE